MRLRATCRSHRVDHGTGFHPVAHGHAATATASAAAADAGSHFTTNAVIDRPSSSFGDSGTCVANDDQRTGTCTHSLIRRSAGHDGNFSYASGWQIFQRR
jgi:hypothetical protein